MIGVQVNNVNEIEMIISDHNTIHNVDNRVQKNYCTRMADPGDIPAGAGQVAPEVPAPLAPAAPPAGQPGQVMNMVNVVPS